MRGMLAESAQVVRRVAPAAEAKVGWTCRMNQEPFPLHRVYNQFEAGLWFLIALVLVVCYRRRLPQPWRWLLPAAFALFGVSDVIELDTGAWWRPWWLGVMKAACVLVFVLALRAHLRHGKAHGKVSDKPHDTGPGAGG